MSDIHQALHAIQKTLNAPKNQKNKFGGYSFRSCEDILTALKDVLPTGSTVTLSDELMMIGERYYNKATATFHCNGQSISTNAYAREDVAKKGMDLAQLNGSISSYSRKYALQGLFMIDDAKHEPIEDIDSLDNGQTSKKLQEAFKKKDKKAVFEIESNLSKEEWKEGTRDLSNDEYNWVCDVLDEVYKQKGANENG